MLNDLNLHVRRTKSFRTKDMISGVSDSLTGVSDIVGVLMCAVWLLGLAVLFLAFRMSVNERKKEFAVLRIAGASKKKLAGIVMSEALMITLAGAAVGIIIGLLMMISFNGLIEESTGLPFLLPDGGAVALCAVFALAVSVIGGMISAVWTAGRISRIDAGVILRGEN